MRTCRNHYPVIPRVSIANNQKKNHFFFWFTMLDNRHYPYLFYQINNQLKNLSLH